MILGLMGCARFRFSVDLLVFSALLSSIILRTVVRNSFVDLATDKAEARGAVFALNLDELCKTGF